MLNIRSPKRHLHKHELSASEGLLISDGGNKLSRFVVAAGYNGLILCQREQHCVRVLLMTLA